ncbi:hypothetical protein [Solirubrum puertoriconensis]|uniref:Uncharacterized protein n=1 Tax=Solirubrum puertoriconensis TaxID=1751427 RepID=A0A9X0L2Y4_SOLP1|nr:hypothetical protein [Solirubrum puertoriconensis]KUG05824.1 hypothetical protein ASU33_00075 [Solirubrum puertoriconensis]
MKRFVVYSLAGLLLACSLLACDSQQRDMDQISTESPTTTNSTNPEADSDTSVAPEDTATVRL